MQCEISVKKNKLSKITEGVLKADFLFRTCNMEELISICPVYCSYFEERSVQGHPLILHGKEICYILFTFKAIYQSNL
jgi:hypothetical protein